MQTDWLDKIAWNEQGLVPAIAQDVETGKVLMLAWMNREALQLTRQKKRAVYWSRSRSKLWLKGEESGQIQHVKDIRLDCDNDVILLKVEQKGVACHTGRHNCFFQQLQDEQWVDVEPVLKDPAVLYAK
ncbi:phosphoribosyl-AMP cyclohydrolase [Candidatus Halobeggiatoa sp. HSG11]|nr:phosphoribosyl-AMP cyclohydrolase [Candidatus Halobeggiatoa sp. HSG11]